APEPDFVERGRGGAVHILAHEVEHRPGGEAFQRQQRFRPRLLADMGDFLHVAEKACLVDQVVRGLDGHSALLAEVRLAGCLQKKSGFRGNAFWNLPRRSKRIVPDSFEWKM